MYLVLVYDIKLDDEGPKVLRRVFKICKKYLTHIQNSVFEGELSEAQLLKLKIEIKVYLRDNIDSCIIFLDSEKFARLRSPQIARDKRGLLFMENYLS